MFEELSLHILDIAMNSMAAGASTLQITVIEDARRDALTIRIRDDGRGMDAATLQRVSTTATTTTMVTMITATAITTRGTTGAARITATSGRAST